MDALGRHLLLELGDCNPETLNDVDILRDCLCEAARTAGATVVGEAFHRFSPHGVSGVVIISESHLSIHSWPEFGYAAADIFTCGTSTDPLKAAQFIIDKLESRQPSVTEMKRGILLKVPVGKGR
ncbi:MAG: adenosylmethionine decarboxylase [Chloroflexota bacterium]